VPPKKKNEDEEVFQGAGGGCTANIMATPKSASWAPEALSPEKTADIKMNLQPDIQPTLE